MQELKARLCSKPLVFTVKRNRLNLEPKRYIREWRHTSHPERDRRRSATESLPAQLGLAQRLPGPAAARRQCFRSLDRLETIAYRHPGHPVHKSHAEPRIRQSGHGRYTPRNSMPYRRFYFRGSITFGAFSWLHRFQFSINSPRCSVAHSNTNAIAWPGKEPRMTRKSRSSISASCSAYRAWKCGGPFQNPLFSSSILASLISSVTNDKHSSIQRLTFTFVSIFLSSIRNCLLS
jgi:hypothetical protein